MNTTSELDEEKDRHRIRIRKEDLKKKRLPLPKKTEKTMTSPTKRRPDRGMSKGQRWQNYDEE